MLDCCAFASNVVLRICNARNVDPGRLPVWADDHCPGCFSFVGSASASDLLPERCTFSPGPHWSSAFWPVLSHCSYIADRHATLTLHVITHPVAVHSRLRHHSLLFRSIPVYGILFPARDGFDSHLAPATVFSTATTHSSSLLARLQTPHTYPPGVGLPCLP